MSDDAFLEVLNSCTEVAQGMDLSDDGWMPPNGNYDVVVEDVASGLKEKNGVNNAWVKPVFTIMNPGCEFDGKSFSDYYWIQPGLTEPSISLKNLCRFATCLQGSETKNPIEAAEIAKASVGEFLSVEVYRTTSKKTSKTYANIRFLARLEATEEGEEAEVAAE
ncbi:MAG: hypothetical protein KAJ19_12795 [Gammaproteobacteria bacterium]|nr:hypothetical protein [Gammaproteobacteria bacterium]